MKLNMVRQLTMGPDKKTAGPFDNPVGCRTGLLI
jgi:hypothetical protein